MTTPDDLNTRKLLYTYWNELPFQIDIDSIKFFQLDQSRVKSFITKYIRDGIRDEFSENLNLPRRHAFTAKELHSAYEKATNQQYSLSNFHYHLKKLMEEGFIKEVAKLLEGRHYQTYYGRTAITFETGYDENMEAFLSKNVFDPLKLVMQEFNPELDSSYLNSLMEENIQQLQDFYFRLRTWTKINYPLLYRSKMDLRALSNYIAHYALVHQKLAGTLEQIAKLIGLDEILEYDRYERSDEEVT